MRSTFRVIFELVSVSTIVEFLHFLYQILSKVFLNLFVDSISPMISNINA